MVAYRRSERVDEYEEAVVARLVKELAVGDIDLGDQAVLVEHMLRYLIIEVFKEREIKFMVASDAESGAGRDDGVQILTLHAAKN